MLKTRPAPTAATVRPRQARDPGQAGVSAGDVLRRGGPRAALPGAHPARPPQCVPHTPYSRARSGRACPAPAHVAPGSLAGAAFYLDIYFRSMMSSAVFVDYVKAWRWAGHNKDEVALGCECRVARVGRLQARVRRTRAWRGRRRWRRRRCACGARACTRGGRGRCAAGVGRGAVRVVCICRAYSPRALAAVSSADIAQGRCSAECGASTSLCCAHDADSLQPCLHVLQSRASVPAQWPARSRGRHIACCLVRCWWPLLFANWALVG